MLVKVCGMTQKENIFQVSSLSPDFLGFIFYSKSPRNALGMSLDIIQRLPKNIQPVAVFVNSDYDEIIETVNRYGIKTIQLHGEESSEFCKKLKNKGFTIIKAIKVPYQPNENFFDCLESYKGKIDLFLFDTAGSDPGGNGQKFNWKILNNYSIEIPFLLSGGIGPDDLEAIKSFHHVQLIGVDLNSRFEISPGFKSIPLLSRFLNTLKQ